MWLDFLKSFDFIKNISKVYPVRKIIDSKYRGDE